MSIEKHKEILTKMHNIYKAKNSEYGNSFSITFKKYGIISALTQMFHKWNRLENLVMDKNASNSNESLEDSLLDLGNYCILTLIELENNKIKKGKKTE